MFWLYLLFVTSVTFALYAYDKSQAIRSGPRVPETVLLGVGFMGGTIGGILAMRLLRHKNRKGSFQVKFWGLTLLQLGMVIYMPERIVNYAASIMQLFFF